MTNEEIVEAFKNEARKLEHWYGDKYFPAGWLAEDRGLGSQALVNAYPTLIRSEWVYKIDFNRIVVLTCINLQNHIQDIVNGTATELGTCQDFVSAPIKQYIKECCVDKLSRLARVESDNGDYSWVSFHEKFEQHFWEHGRRYTESFMEARDPSDPSLCADYTRFLKRCYTKFEEWREGLAAGEVDPDTLVKEVIAEGLTAYAHGRIVGAIKEDIDETLKEEALEARRKRILEEKEAEKR